MEKSKNVGSKNFWMVLALLLGTFLLVFSIILFFIIPRATTIYQQAPSSVVIQSETEAVDHSFESTRERIDSVNQYYGQQIKSKYSGQNSTMEQLARQRMFLSTIKNLLMYTLLVLVILLILIKGFGVSIFKKKTVNEKPKSDNSPKKENKETPAEKEPAPKQEESTLKPENPASEPKRNTPNSKKSKSNNNNYKKATDKKVVASDKKDIVSNCQLP